MATRTKPLRPRRRPAGIAKRPNAAASDGERLRGRVARGALRGAVASMAMTGLREFTRHVGLLEEPPPESIIRQKLTRRRLRGVERGPLRAGVEVVHWSYGAAAGALFAALPQGVRRSAWSGPLFGMLVLSGFELVLAPMLALSQARRVRLLDRIALVGDHLLYGALLTANAPMSEDDSTPYKPRPRRAPLR